MFIQPPCGCGGRRWWGGLGRPGGGGLQAASTTVKAGIGGIMVPDMGDIKAVLL